MPLAHFILSTFPGRMSGHITPSLSLHRGSQVSSSSHHKNTNISFGGKQIQKKNTPSLLIKEPVSTSKITAWSVNSTVSTRGNQAPLGLMTSRVTPTGVAMSQAFPMTQSYIVRSFRAHSLHFISLDALKMPRTAVA